MRPYLECRNRGAPFSTEWMRERVSAHSVYACGPPEMQMEQSPQVNVTMATAQGAALSRRQFRQCLRTPKDGDGASNGAQLPLSAGTFAPALNWSGAKYAAPWRRLTLFHVSLVERTPASSSGHASTKE
jgi:hypothetical protein